MASNERALLNMGFRIIAILVVFFCILFTDATPAAAEETDFIQQLTSGSVYEQGPYTVRESNVTTAEAPRAAIMLFPGQPGKYPVIYFHHGFQLRNVIYTQMLSLISSHGFIIIAPSIESFSMNARPDIQAGAQVLEWLPDNLETHLMQGVHPDFEKVVLMGHSKGGKIAFALALNTTTPVKSLNFSAVIGLDPVDGTTPVLLTRKNDTFQLPFPTLLIGTGYGPERKFFVLPPCAPEKDGHKHFFMDSSPLAFDITPLYFGHMDFVNDKLNTMETLADWMCKESAEGRSQMRTFTGGVVVAFLRAVLFDEVANFKAILDNPENAPIAIAPPRSKLHDKLSYTRLKK